MSKVELSLVEYNELMEEFRMYKEIVEAVTTPSIDPWSLEYYKEHPESNLSLYTEGISSLVSSKTRKFLSDSITAKSKAFLESLNLGGEFTLNDNVLMKLGDVERATESDK